MSEEEVDATGWKVARRFIEFSEDEPKGVPVVRDHHKYLDK